MGLDYTSGCVNFRDIGGYINLITDKNLLPEGKLFRGGSIDYVKEHADLRYVKSIINLRNSIDPKLFNTEYFHFPMSNKIEKYDTSNQEVRAWLNDIIKLFENGNLKYPVLIHCLYGKDRTGIVTAALLKILGIDNDSIEHEYLLTEGDVHLSLIQFALAGFDNIETYFNKLDLNKIRALILEV